MIGGSRTSIARLDYLSATVTAHRGPRPDDLTEGAFSDPKKGF